MSRWKMSVPAWVKRQQWHSWFAWFPVDVTQRYGPNEDQFCDRSLPKNMVWWERVERKEAAGLLGISFWVYRVNGENQ